MMAAEGENLDYKLSFPSVVSDNGVVFYRVTVEWNGEKWSVLRRFSEFDALQKKLELSNTEKKVTLPRFPPKSWTWNAKLDSVVEERRTALQKYLNDCIPLVRGIHQMEYHILSFTEILQRQHIPPSGDEFAGVGDQELILADGRKLAYREHGVKDGAIFVFIPGPGFGRLARPEMHDLLRLHLRCITLDRPGFGLSSEQPGRSLKGFAEDLRALLDHLKVQRAAFLGHSTGCPHLLAFCSAYPERVERCALVCCPHPVVGPETPEETVWHQKVKVLALTQALGVVAPILQLHAKRWQADPGAFAHDAIWAMLSSSDVKWMREHPEKVDELTLWFSAAVTPPAGSKAMADDMLLPAQPWDFYLSAISVRVLVFSGAEDEVAPHSPWIATVLPDAQHHMIEKAGHNAVFSHFARILDELYLDIGCS